jgi:Mobilization protein NikA
VCGRVGRRGWLPGTPEESFEELERDAHAGRTVKFDLRCSADEKLRWAEAASTLGLSVSAFVRDVANQAADECSRASRSARAEPPAICE